MSSLKVNWSSQHEHGTKKKSPWKELNPWPPKHRAGTLSIDLQELSHGELGHSTEFNVTGILNTSRISIVKVFVNRESNMTGVLNTARISIVEAIMNSDKWVSSPLIYSLSHTHGDHFTFHISLQSLQLTIFILYTVHCNFGQGCSFCQ